jgi:DNA-binding response OmpR family regulator
MQDVATAAKRVLVADDDPGVSALLSRWLTMNGYTVSTADDGIKACESADQQPPDLILLDLQLPRRDGYAVLLTLGSREATANIPVLIVSGESNEHADIARTLGARGFLQKPFTRESVMKAVGLALRGDVHGDK